MRTSLKKAFRLIVITIVMLEALSWCIYFAVEKKMFSYADTQAYREELRSTLLPHVDIAERPATEFSLAPYLGYVRAPNYKGPSSEHVIPQGFFGEEDPLPLGHNPLVAIVGITGGTMAESLYTDARATLHRTLDALPIFKDKRVVIIMLGAQGYHEPQQALSLHYYLMQGGKLDMLINLDGRNEAVLGYDNISHGVHPSYPYFWGPYFQLNNITTLNNPWRIRIWKNLRHELAGISSYGEYSVTINTLWLLLDHACLHQQQKAELTLQQASSDPDYNYFLTGSDRMAHASPQQIAQYEVNLWEEGSLQMNSLAQMHHFYYFHFLQPSQYLPGSKTLSAQETATAPEKDNEWIPAVYPLMQERMKALRERGVAIEDLSGIYKNTTGTIYRKTCCLVNQQGSDMLADAIAAQVARAVTSHPAP